MADEVKTDISEEKPSEPKKQNFFKSTSFKCIIVLLAIVLVCGILLTICNSLFYVSDEERLNRAISKIYGYEMTVTEVEVTTSNNTQGSTTILAAYEDENGDYLIQSKGKGGYAGTVTCWVLVDIENDAVAGISKVTVSGSDGETLLSKINFLDSYASAEYTDGFTFTTDDGYMTTGATLSSTAINNAVNGAISFVKYVCLGETDPYAAYTNYSYINMESSAWSTDNGVTTYNLVTTSNGAAEPFTITITVDSSKTIRSFEIITNGSTSGYESKMMDTSTLEGKTQTEIEALLEELTNTVESGASTSIGAARSNELCLNAALFAVSNYDFCSVNDKTAEGEEQEEPEEPDIYDGYAYTDYIDSSATTYTVIGTEVTYNITTTSYGAANSFTITVTVDSDKTVKSFEIVTNGSTYGFETSMMDTSNYVGKTQTDLEALLDELDQSISTGASTGAARSDTLCLNAALFAVANYDLCYETYFNETYSYTEYIDSSATTYKVSGTEVTYSITTTSYGAANSFTITVTVDSTKTVTSFVIDTNGSTYGFETSMMDTSNYVGKTQSELEALLSELDESISTGASTGAARSDTLCLNAALFAVANYDICYEAYFNETYAYSDYISSTTTYSVSDTLVTYNITTTSNSPANAFTITVIVDSDKTVKSFEIVTNGSTYGFESSMMNTSLVGKTQSELEAIIGGTSETSISTGATRSNELCVYAALFAVANYDICVGGAE